MNNVDFKGPKHEIGTLFTSLSEVTSKSNVQKGKTPSAPWCFCLLGAFLGSRIPACTSCTHPHAPPPKKMTFQAIIFMAWTPLGRGRGVPFGDQDPHPLALINPSFHIGPGALLGPVLTGRQRVTLFTAELRCCWNRGAACRYPGLCLVTPRKWCHVPSDLTLGSR